MYETPDGTRRLSSKTAKRSPARTISVPHTATYTSCGTRIPRISNR